MTPSPAELKKALERSCQLWLISSGSPLLNKEHVASIKAFFADPDGHTLALMQEAPKDYTPPQR